jgi:hypothetical protein
MWERLKRRFLCSLRLHGMRTQSDGVGVWGECEHCHEKAGYVTHVDIRRYMDRCEAKGVCDICEQPKHFGPCTHF